MRVTRSADHTNLRARLGGAVRYRLIAILALLATAGFAAPATSGPEQTADPYLWLENAQSPAALAWVAQENAKTEAALKRDPRFKPSYDALLALATGAPDPPQPAPLGGGVVVYTATADHPHGALDWTSLADFQ